MPINPQWSVRKFGAASTVNLSASGGAVLHGIWVSTKGTSPTLTVYNAAASVTGSDVIPATVVGTLGFWNTGDIVTGTALTVKTASMTGAIFWTPAAS